MQKNIAFDFSHAAAFLEADALQGVQEDLRQAQDLLHQKKGPGREYTDWLDWPCRDIPGISKIRQLARQVRENAEAFLVLGVGGSYLGSRSAVELFRHTFYNQLPGKDRQGPEIYFAGHNLSPRYISHLLDILGEKDLVVNVISKSGTTLEPALAFRMIRTFLEKKYGAGEARRRIIVTTDPGGGILKEIAGLKGYSSLAVPTGIGGRYSVLTAVGLLPMAAAGLDIDEIISGARAGYGLCRGAALEENPALAYAALRNLLYRRGKIIELLVSYEPSFYYFTEWWKQLFGESEGKEQKGIFPAGMNNTTDLHALGQYVQDGARHLFATTMWLEKPLENLFVQELEEDLDQLNYLAGHSWHEINQKACAGTIAAHTAGQVPNLKITIPELSPFYYGQLVYFFQKACALSAYLLGVNPFDQPGVEAYKNKILSLLHP